MRLSVSIGIMAFNEGKNIGRLLDSLLRQNLKRVTIREIIIISSGSTDKTDKVVRKFQSVRENIKLFRQKKREGKAAAVNLFLGKAKENLLVLIGADLLLKETTIENLIIPFQDLTVGIVGAHPLPVNSPKTFMGFAAHLLWELHHQISLKTPKMGEVIAFRKVFQKIPVLSAVDEANIEPLIRGQGYKAVYAPEAVIYNKGPETIQEFVNCRRRIFFGHLATKHEYSYEVSTFKGWKIFLLVFKNMKLSLQYFLFTPVVILLEVYSRLLGWLDYKFKFKNHTIWQINPTTKDLTGEQLV